MICRLIVNVCILTWKITEEKPVNLSSRPSKEVAMSPIMLRDARSLTVYPDLCILAMENRLVFFMALQRRHNESYLICDASRLIV